jgi:hypothetical protein
MKNIYKIATILTVVILISCPMLALAGGPGFGGGVDDGGNTCSVPLDGGLTLLVASGLGYGIKKFSKKKRILPDSK